MESATCCGMELIAKQSYGIKPQGREYTLARDAMRPWRFHTMRKRIDDIPSLRLE